MHYKAQTRTIRDQIITREVAKLEARRAAAIALASPPTTGKAG